MLCSSGYCHLGTGPAVASSPTRWLCVAAEHHSQQASPSTFREASAVQQAGYVWGGGIRRAGGGRHVNARWMRPSAPVSTVRCLPEDISLQKAVQPNGGMHAECGASEHLQPACHQLLSSRCMTPCKAPSITVKSHQMKTNQVDHTCPLSMPSLLLPASWPPTRPPRSLQHHLAPLPIHPHPLVAVPSVKSCNTLLPAVVQTVVYPEKRIALFHCALPGVSAISSCRAATVTA